MPVTETLAEPTRSQRLKAATNATHGALDKTIMGGDIFANRAQFAKFLRVQYRFHRTIDALYDNELLAALIPGLSERRRLARIAHDLGDLGETRPAPEAGKLEKDTPLPTALGWLYVAEGSNLGGAVLYKLARDKLGLDKDFGVTHLTAHPDGASRHWRQFTGALDAVALSPAQEEEVVRGAEDAFRSVRGYVAEEIPVPDAGAVP